MALHILAIKTHHYMRSTSTLGDTMTRIIERTQEEECGCYVQLVHDTWMGEEIVWENPVICSEHW
jgi:hypothetical protein